MALPSSGGGAGAGSRRTRALQGLLRGAQQVDRGSAVLHLALLSLQQAPAAAAECHEWSWWPQEDMRGWRLQLAEHWPGRMEGAGRSRGSWRQRDCRRAQHPTSKCTSN